MTQLQPYPKPLGLAYFIKFEYGKKRVVTHDVVLSGNTTDGQWTTFKLTKGEIFETFESDVYGKIRTIIQEKELKMFTVTLERMSDIPKLCVECNGIGLKVIHNQHSVTCDSCKGDGIEYV